MSEYNDGSFPIDGGRTSRAVSSVSTERRLQGWAAALIGAAMMAAGGMIFFLSAY
jgi:hypothetical protein